MDITAAVTRTSGDPFSIERLELESPREHEVLVEIKGVGLCHTDIAARNQVMPVPLPSVLGHEGSGIVRAVGSAVTKVREGDAVAISFNSCGECSACLQGDPAYCRQFAPLNYGGGRPDGTTALSADGAPVHGNFFGQSSFASHAIAHERNVVPVGDDVPLELVGTLGCGFQTGAGAVINSMEVREGSVLLVLGGGPVGLAAVMAGRIQGCSQVIVSEPHESRRTLALEIGATAAIDPTAGSVADQVHALAPDGADYVFDTTGNDQVIGAALEAVAVKATLGLVGVPSDFSAALPVTVVGAMGVGLTVRGITEGDADPDVFVPLLLDHYRAGRFPFDRLITTYPLAQINEAVEAQHRGEAIKVVLVPDAA